MKKITLFCFVFAMGYLTSCGPSKEEIEAEAKRVADSIAVVEVEAKKMAEEAAAEVQRIADSTAAAEAAKAAADSAEAAGKKK